MRVLAAAVLVLIVIGAVATIGVDGIIGLAATGYDTISTAVQNEIHTG